MPCLTHSLARAMFAKMAQIKPEDVPQDDKLWDDAMWELLSLVAERIADDFYYRELQENTIRDPEEFENTTCKFAELISSNWFKERKENIDSIQLITSYYHIPRSLIIFKKFFPNKKLITVPVSKFSFSKELFFHIRLIFSEYFKIFYTFIYLL